MTRRWLLMLLRYPPVTPLATIMTNIQVVSASSATASELSRPARTSRRRRLLTALILTSFMTPAWNASVTRAEAPPKTGWEAIQRKMQGLLGVKKKHHSNCDGACDELGETWIYQSPASMPEVAPSIPTQPIRQLPPVVSPFPSQSSAPEIEMPIRPEAQAPPETYQQPAELPLGPPPTPEPIPAEPEPAPAPADEAPPIVDTPMQETQQANPFDDMPLEEAPPLDSSTDGFDTQDSSRRAPMPSEATPDPIEALNLDSTPEPAPELPVAPEPETQLDPMPLPPSVPPANLNSTETVEPLPAPAEPMPSLFGDDEPVETVTPEPMPESTQPSLDLDSTNDLFPESPEDPLLFGDPLPPAEPEPKAEMVDPFGDAFSQPGPSEPSKDLEPIDPATTPAIPQPMAPTDSDNLDELFGTPPAEGKKPANPSDVQTDLDSLFNDIPGVDALDNSKEETNDDDLLDSLFNNIPRRFNEQARSQGINGMRMSAPIIRPIAGHQPQSSKPIRQATHLNIKRPSLPAQGNWSSRSSNR